MDEDEDLGPQPIGGELTQNYIDTKWREAARAAREGREHMNDIWPELSMHLPETAQRHLKRALDAFDQATSELHLAGRHVLGEDEHMAYLVTLTERQLNQ